MQIRAATLTSRASPFRVLLWLVLAAIALSPGAKAATIVYSNIDSTDCGCGAGGAYLAEQFTPDGDYSLVDVAARLENFGPSFTETFSILSDSGGLPDAILTQLTASVPAWGGTGSPWTGVLTSNAPPTPLTLLVGTPYWLVVQTPEQLYWERAGNSSAPYAYSDSIGGPYTSGGDSDFQFEVDGDPPAAPEPGVTSLAGLGLALLAGAKLRYERGCRRRNQSPRLP
jgi:hypothetical protein